MCKKIIIYRGNQKLTEININNVKMYKTKIDNIDIL